MDKGKQMRFADEELALIKATFGGSDGGVNETLLKLLRKVFLPEYDPTAPVGQAVDLWMTLDVRSLSPDEAYVRLLARNELISHVDQQLMQIQFLAAMKDETVDERNRRIAKDSVK